jgi:hypothetical protein
MTRFEASKIMDSSNIRILGSKPAPGTGVCHVVLNLDQKEQRF